MAKAKANQNTGAAGAPHSWAVAVKSKTVDHAITTRGSTMHQSDRPICDCVHQALVCRDRGQGVKAKQSEECNGIR